MTAVFFAVFLAATFLVAALVAVVFLAVVGFVEVRLAVAFFCVGLRAGLMGAGR